MQVKARGQKPLPPRWAGHNKQLQPLNSQAYNGSDSLTPTMGFWYLL